MLGFLFRNLARGKVLSLVGICGRPLSHNHPANPSPSDPALSVAEMNAPSSTRGLIKLMPQANLPGAKVLAVTRVCSLQRHSSCQRRVQVDGKCE